MSRRATAAWRGAVALLIAGAADAQDIRHQAAILDSIAGVQRRAIARRTAWDDSVARSRANMDSVTVGPMRLLLRPEDRELVTTAAHMALDSLRIMGDSVLAMIRPYRIVIWRVPAPRWAPGRTPAAVVALVDSSGVEGRRMVAYEPTPHVVGDYLAEQARGVIASLVDSTLSRWLGAASGNAPIRFDTVTAETWSRLRLNLVSSPAVVARRCYDGNLADCHKVLGLQSSAFPVREYFDADGRRFVVGQREGMLRRRDRARTEACLAGDDAACIVLLESVSMHLPAAFDVHRIALLQLAIQQGGATAGARALRSQEAPARWLATVSGLPTDSLVLLWHERMRHVRAPSANMTSGMAVASLGWIALLVLFASRSRRWR